MDSINETAMVTMDSINETAMVTIDSINETAMLKMDSINEMAMVTMGSINETAMEIMDQGILISGGEGAVSSVEVLNPSTGKTCSLPSLPDKRESHTSTGLTLCGGLY